MRYGCRTGPATVVAPEAATVNVVEAEMARIRAGWEEETRRDAHRVARSGIRVEYDVDPFLLALLSRYVDALAAVARVG